jgi:hypothetical protein
MITDNLQRLNEFLDQFDLDEQERLVRYALDHVVPKLHRAHPSEQAGEREVSATLPKPADAVAVELAAAHASPAMAWPASRDVGRLDDMSPDHHLRLVLDSDNDVCVEIFDGKRFGSVEFCNGGGGGGQSMHTRKALIELMCAMERDNAERPNRAGGITPASGDGGGDAN